MEAFLHMPMDERRVLCEQAQGRLSLQPASVEKDFWVCWTLRELFNLPEWGEHLTFKGGTSLSKAWKLIKRFSEDIDIVIERDFLGFGGETLSKGRIKKLVKTCSQRIQNELKPSLEARINSALSAADEWTLKVASGDEDPDQQTLFFHYPSSLGGNAAYVRAIVRIEMGARSDVEPAESAIIQPYLADAFPEILGKSSFSVRTIAARRTFWEKAMLLHEETYRPADKPRKARLARHYYDLWSLIEHGVGKDAANDLELFSEAARHRQSFFGINWMDYSTLRKGSLRIVPLDDQLVEWRRDYQAMREEMFFGEVPQFDAIMVTVREFQDAFNQDLEAEPLA